MRYIICLFGGIVLLSGCSSDPVVLESQKIHFSKYAMDISVDFAAKPKDDVIDARVMKKVVSVYQKPISSLDFSDNLIISQDTLTPSISLDDYVQAAIGGISYTRGKYKSISFVKGTIICNKKEIPTIKNIFSIYRSASLTNTDETLYFVQYFLHNDDEVMIISFTTNEESTTESLSTTLDTLSCT